MRNCSRRKNLRADGSSSRLCCTEDLRGEDRHWDALACRWGTYHRSSKKDGFSRTGRLEFVLVGCFACENLSVRADSPLS